jgi:hypothetical protein
MQLAILLDDIGLIVRHWYEVGPDDEEHGARVEIRTLARATHVGSESAAQPITLDRPLWRADIFDLIGAEPGNLLRAHFHPSFLDREPVDRHWDQAVREDWRSWLSARLSNLPDTLAAADLLPGQLDDAPQLARYLPSIVGATEWMLGEHCDGGVQCLAATLDTRAAVDMMIDQFRPSGTVDPRSVAVSR